MRSNKKYLFPIIAAIAVVCALIWEFATNKNPRHILPPSPYETADFSSTAPDNTPESIGSSDAYSSSEASSSAEASSSMPESASAEEQSSSESIAPSTQEQSAEESITASTPAQSSEAPVSSEQEGLILDDNGEIIINVPDGEGSFGE